MLPATIIAVSLFAYSHLFVAAFAVPKLIVLGLGAGALCLALALEGKVRRMSTLTWVVLGCYLLSALFADDKPLAFIGNYNDYSHGFLGIAIASIFFLYPDHDKEMTENIIALCAAVIGVFAFYQWSVSHQYMCLTNGRAIGSIGSPVSLGIVLAILMPLAYSKSNVYALAVAMGIIASGSRGALLASVAGTMIYRWRK